MKILVFCECLMKKTQKKSTVLIHFKKTENESLYSCDFEAKVGIFKKSV